MMIPKILLCAGACVLLAATSDHDSAVTIDNFTFNAGRIVVSTGTKVTWTNHDDIPHTVTSADDPGLFHSHPLDTGDGFSFVFTKAGTFRYFCALHPKMQGIVVVR